MNRYSYEESRDTAWRILIKYQVSSLPIKISEICKGEGLHILSYAKGHSIIEEYALQENCAQNDGFLFRGIIFYNEKCNIGRQRFTVAHELGHVVRGHTGILINREPNPKDNPIEQEANVFASRILSPACVMWGLGVTCAEEIEELCDISKLSARFRMERLQLLYDREKQFLYQWGRSCFLQSPLEQEVYRQVEGYISQIKGADCHHPQWQKAFYPQEPASPVKTFLQRFSHHDDK